MLHVGLFDLFIEDLRQRFPDDRSLCEEKLWWLFGDDISDGYGNNKKKKKSIENDIKCLVNQ